MMDKTDKPDIIDSMLATESTEATEPAEPMDSIDPAEPIDRIEPVDPMDRIEPVEPMLSNEPAEPSELPGPADDESRRVAMIAFSQHGRRPASCRHATHVGGMLDRWITLSTGRRIMWNSGCPTLTGQLPAGAGC
jgi:hypothetical protein